MTSYYRHVSKIQCISLIFNSNTSFLYRIKNLFQNHLYANLSQQRLQVSSGWQHVHHHGNRASQARALPHWDFHQAWTQACRVMFSSPSPIWVSIAINIQLLFISSSFPSGLVLVVHSGFQISKLCRIKLENKYCIKIRLTEEKQNMHNTF